MRTWIPTLMAAALLTACGSPINKLCKKSADCDPDYDEDTCRSDFEAFEEAADELDCTKELNDFVKCNAKNGECTDGYISTDACGTEDDAFFTCFFGDFELTFGTSSYTSSSY